MKKLFLIKFLVLTVVVIDVLGVGNNLSQNLNNENQSLIADTHTDLQDHMLEQLKEAYKNFKNDLKRDQLRDFLQYMIIC